MVTMSKVFFRGIFASIAAAALLTSAASAKTIMFKDSGLSYGSFYAASAKPTFRASPSPRVETWSFGEYDTRKTLRLASKPTIASSSVSSLPVKDYFMGTVKVTPTATPVVAVDTDFIEGPSSIEAELARLALTEGVETPIPGAAVLFGTVLAGGLWRMRRKKKA
jgi:hypothetical protein